MLTSPYFVNSQRLDRIHTLFVALGARLARTPLGLLHDWLRWGSLGLYVWRSRRIPGWTRGREAVELARACYGLEGEPVVIEIGSFLGASAVLLAGARKLRGSGCVHCIDPFDASGDAFSVPFYRAAAGRQANGLRSAFEDNVRSAGVARWIDVHAGRAADVAEGWRHSVDMLFMDGDQTYAVVMEEYRLWEPHLKVGGILAVHNSIGDPRPPDGHRRLVEEAIKPPRYEIIARHDFTTFARKVCDGV